MNSFRSSQKQEGMVDFIGLLKVKVIKGTNLAIRDMMTSDPYVVLTLGRQTVQTCVVASNLNPVWNEELTLSVPQSFGSLKLSAEEFQLLFLLVLAPCLLVLVIYLSSCLDVVTSPLIMMHDHVNISKSIAMGLFTVTLLLVTKLQQVYDYDTFSADDIMGEADIDLQPLITSAMAFGDAGLFSNMQIGKWLKSHDNALMSDSTVNIVDGKVKQEMTLKLQNVESGELDLELEWMAS
ncbi:putative ADP-ribosylation factor GTPase-activating protein AGD13, partial [Cucurbita argyrosperma subsp. argyrosperma]